MHLTPTQERVICLAGTSAFTAVSLTPGGGQVGGWLGTHVGGGLYGFAGGAAWLLPALLADELIGVLNGRQNAGKRRLHWACGFVTACTLLGLGSHGGLLGGAIAGGLNYVVGAFAWVVVLVAAFCAAQRVLGPSRCTAIAVHVEGWQRQTAHVWRQASADLERERIARAIAAHVIEPAACAIAAPSRSHAVPPPLPVRRPQPAPVHAPEAYDEPEPGPVSHQPAPSTRPRAWKLPSVALLSEPAPRASAAAESTELDRTALQLSKLFLAHGVHAKKAGVCRGPLVDRYEFELVGGDQKVSDFAKLAPEVEMAHANSRVLGAIPGSGHVGVELARPEGERAVITLREVLESDAWRKQQFALPLALGVTPTGEVVAIDLSSTKCPHLLIAGTTGAGKSVGLHCMLASLLMSRTPEQLRLCLIDPKKVELSAFRDVPHLLAPVAKKDADALQLLNWACAEMDRRYEHFDNTRVSSLSDYNELGRDQMPRIVLVIDEYADLCDTAVGDVEEPVRRLAQLGRAAGIHLIVATQRPSTDVISGRIKAVFPARISYKVASRHDSMTIIEQYGAQHLLGCGDCLCMIATLGTDPVRVHGPLASPQDVRMIVDAWRAQGSPRYVDMGGDGEGSSEPEADAGDAELERPAPHKPAAAPRDDYDRALEYAGKNGCVSVNLLTGALAIGNPKASKLIKRMDDAGLLEPGVGNAPRRFRKPN